MTRNFPRKYLAAPAAAIGAAALAFTVLAQPAPATTVIVDDEHWDLVAEVDCLANTVELLTENHDADPPVVQALADTVFEVDEVSDDAQEAADQNRFDPDPLRALSHLEAEAAPDGQLVLGFDVEYDANCEGATPDVTFRVVSGSTLPTGGRAAAYQATPHTNTQLDTSTGTGRNQGLVTDTHEDRRWGFSVAGDYGVKVRAQANPAGTGNVSDTETVSFAVR